MKTYNTEDLLNAIEINYDNTEDLSTEVILGHWERLAEAYEDRTTMRYYIVHAALPFTITTSLYLGAREAFAYTTTLAECFARSRTNALSEAVQLLYEAQADLERFCGEHDLDANTHTGTTLARVTQFLQNHPR